MFRKVLSSNLPFFGRSIDLCNHETQNWLNLKAEFSTLHFVCGCLDPSFELFARTVLESRRIWAIKHSWAGFCYREQARVLLGSFLGCFRCGWWGNPVLLPRFWRLVKMATVSQPFFSRGCWWSFRFEEAEKRWESLLGLTPSSRWWWVFSWATGFIEHCWSWH